MTSKALGRGLGWQQLNGLINLYLIKQNLNKFSEVFVKQMVYKIFAQNIVKYHGNILVKYHGNIL